MTPTLSIVSATAADTPVILELIRALADYERLSHLVTTTETELREVLFDANPAAEVLLAREGEFPVGMAVFFHNFSTFLGRRGLYLEDLFVRPEYRGKGYGTALLTHLARVAVTRGYGRVEWSVLDWNAPTIGFYQSLGAVAMDQWTVFRLEGEALKRLGSPGA